ncbi:11583_t:CDS:2, partial [Scutellospora calospora]
AAITKVDAHAKVQAITKVDAHAKVQRSQGWMLTQGASRLDSQAIGFRRKIMGHPRDNTPQLIKIARELNNII